MHVYLNIQRERERTAIILVELFRRKMIEIRILKKLEERNYSFTNCCDFPTKFSADEAGCFSQNLILCCI